MKTFEQNFESSKLVSDLLHCAEKMKMNMKIRRLSSHLLLFIFLLCIFSVMGICCMIDCNKSNLPTDCYDPTKDKYINGDANWACTLQFDPVCGCDQRQYSNECFAVVGGILKWDRGPCQPFT